MKYNYNVGKKNNNFISMITDKNNDFYQRENSLENNFILHRTLNKVQQQ